MNEINAFPHLLPLNRIKLKVKSVFVLLEDTSMMHFLFLNKDLSKGSSVS